jgi:hypothetical protein
MLIEKCSKNYAECVGAQKAKSKAGARAIVTVFLAKNRLRNEGTNCAKKEEVGAACLAISC